MQVKIVIGTISFMLTMIILGFAALREPARLETFSAAAVGRSIETGAHIFDQNCATCHGVNGLAETCYDPSSGAEIGCQGIPLNYAPLLCSEDDVYTGSTRLEQLNWSGSLENFVATTISAGRFGTRMPVWSERFGGPMRDDQVADVTAFVLNWKSEELCAAPPAPDPLELWPETVEEFLAMDGIEPGDPARGEELYTTPYTCNVCHGGLDGSVPASVGPSLVNIAEEGGTRVDGVSAAQYIYRSILVPDEFIAPDCPNGPCTGPPSLMKQTFAAEMADNMQDMADILAYLLGE